MKDSLTETIIGCAMKIHRALGAGFLESVYGNALAHELGKAAVNFEREKAIHVLYDNVILGDFRADFLIDNQLIVELKAIENLLPVHEVQVVNYLTATKIDIGLLLNFGSTSLQFKRKHRTPKSAQTNPPRLH